MVESTTCTTTDCSVLNRWVWAGASTDPPSTDLHTTGGEAAGPKSIINYYAYGNAVQNQNIQYFPMLEKNK